MSGALDVTGCFRCGDAPELTRHILSKFAKTWPEEVESELRRYLWNSASFGYAVPLAKARGFITHGRAGHFIYHQRTQLMFTGATAHPIMMSYLTALHHTDFSVDCDDWGPSSVYDWNATSRLADEFIEQGLGFYLSAVAGGAITVANDFKWTPQERTVFASFKRRAL